MSRRRDPELEFWQMMDEAEALIGARPRRLAKRHCAGKLAARKRDKRKVRAYAKAYYRKNRKEILAKRAAKRSKDALEVTENKEDNH